MTSKVKYSCDYGDLFLIKGSDQAACYDIMSAEDAIVPAKSSKSIHTGLHFNMGKGIFAEVKSRSGLGFKHEIISFNGIIDSDYRGEVMCLLFNFSDKDYEVKRGDRISQLLFHKVESVDDCGINSTEKFLERVKKIENDTERGEKGFGSSGK